MPGNGEWGKRRKFCPPRRLTCRLRYRGSSIPRRSSHVHQHAAPDFKHSLESHSAFQTRQKTRHLGLFPSALGHSASVKKQKQKQKKKLSAKLLNYFTLKTTKRPRHVSPQNTLHVRGQNLFSSGVNADDD